MRGEDAGGVKDLRMLSYVSSLTVRARLPASGANRSGVAVPSDSSMPGGRAGVDTSSVRWEDGVGGASLTVSKSTSRFLSHWLVFSIGVASVAEDGRSDTMSRPREASEKKKEKKDRNLISSVDLEGSERDNGREDICPTRLWGNRCGK